MIRVFTGIAAIFLVIPCGRALRGYSFVVKYGEKIFKFKKKLEF